MSMEQDVKDTDPVPAKGDEATKKLLAATDTPPEIRWVSEQDERTATASGTIMKMVTVVVGAVWRELPLAVRVIIQELTPNTVVIVASKRLPFLSSAGVLPGSLQVAADAGDIIVPFEDDAARWLADGLVEAFIDAWLLAILGLARRGHQSVVDAANDDGADCSRDFVAAAIVNDVDIFKDRPKLVLAMSEGVANVLQLTGQESSVKLNPSEWGGPR